MQLFKQLFTLMFRLISDPAKAWLELYRKREIDNENFYRTYLFPILGIIALLAFIGGLFEAKTFNVEEALKSVIQQVLTYGISFYLVPYLLSVGVFPRYRLKKDKLLAERFTGYASALIYAVAMVHTLFPWMFFLQLLLVYTAYIVWTGAAQFLRLKEEVLMRFTITAGALIILTPLIIGTVLGWLMPGMKD